MNNKKILSLLWLVIMVSLMSFQIKDQWEFNNFGMHAEGKVNCESKKLTLSTKNTRHCFFETDEYSFIYRNQAFPYDDCSKLTITVCIEQFQTGSAGIMMRSGTEQDASNVHLEVQATGDLFLFYRKSDGLSTSYKRIGKMSFPVEIKLFRQGNVFTGYFKTEGGEWKKGASAIAEVNTASLVGFYACSGNESQIGYAVDSERKTEVVFRDWDIRYQENYTPAEKDFVDMIPVRNGTLLRENFNDGSMSNQPASIINPVWEGVKYAEIPRDSDGKRYWRKQGDGIYYIGDKKWGDYEVNIDFFFDRENPSVHEFTVQLRYQKISVYDKMLRFYGAGFRNGNQLFFEKTETGKLTVEKSVPVRYLDEQKHNLKVTLTDRNYAVYYDGQLVIEGVDTGYPVTYGNMALKFSDTSMRIYQIEVLSVDDAINGNKDNYLLDYFDTPVPAYLKQYENQSF
jgi:hypothetical protein